MVDINNIIYEMNDLILHSVTAEVNIKFRYVENLWFTNIDQGDFQDTLINCKVT